MATATARCVTVPAPVRPSAETRIRAALWFAERGFGVFSVWSTTPTGTCRCPDGRACGSPGKHPITRNGFQDATTDPERIRTLLSAGSDPNYGLVCPEGVFALDVDGDDIPRLRELETRLGALPPTLRTLTANGQHIFLRWPDDVPRPLHKMFGFVTRWGSGRQAGYVVGPRSMHSSGFVYEPEGPFEIAEIPAVWIEASMTGGEQAPVETLTVGGVLPAAGHRHDWLRDRARYYRGFMDDPAVLRAAVLAENARLEEPKTPEEVERAIGDVFVKFPADPREIVDEKVAGHLGEDGLDFLPAIGGAPFPDAPDVEAYAGLLGECVFELAAGTDASLVGLLGACLTFAGALVPGQAYFHRMQTSSPFVALVGESSIGRKGTAMMRVADAMGDAVGRDKVNQAILDGLASGEGLVSAMHWKQTTFQNEPAVGLVFEEEYATLLAARSREGSTLDPKMRAGFDGGVLSNRRSGDSKTVVPPYWLIALIAITPGELRDRLEAGAMTSGSANRWLYLPVIRREIVPTNADPRFSEEHKHALFDARRVAMGAGRPLSVDPAVVRVLAEYADWLPTVAYGLALDLTRRLGVIAFRVALTHALVEQDREVTLTHLRRALALTEYARKGIPWVFGNTIGNRDADLLYRHLTASGRLVKRTITREIIRDPVRQQTAIDELTRLGLAHVEVIHPEGGGRPRTELVSSKSGGLFQGFSSAAFEDPQNLGTIGMNGRNPLFERGEVGRNVEETWTKLDETPPSVDQTRPVGEWCLFFADHQSRHRDIQTTTPWCEICTPRTA
jgi:hypothetical protein